MLEKAGQEDVEENSSSSLRQQASIKKFKDLKDVPLEKQDAIWVCKRGVFEGRDYLIRISKYEISSYIFEDIDNELTLWAQLALKSQSKLSYFTEREIIHLV